MDSGDGGPVWLEEGSERCRRGEPRSLAGSISHLASQSKSKSSHVMSDQGAHGEHAWRGGKGGGGSKGSRLAR